MNAEMKKLKGKALTVRGPVDPEALGGVLMHEHLHSDVYRWETGEFITREQPATPERRQYLLREAVPHLRRLREFGCGGFVDTTPEPWRAWPDVYVEVAEAADVHIVLCCGFYREMELGTYWVKRPEDRIWPHVVQASVEELAEHCVRQIVEGIHGTEVRAGALKVGTSAAEMTPLETKTFRAAARAQKKTGVHLTTHCTRIGAETTQLRVIDAEGADLSRVVIGHAAVHLMDGDCRKICMEWMRRGVNFLPTNLGVRPDDRGECWRPLVGAIHEVFDAGLGDRLCLGLDSGYCSESCQFGPMTFLPPPPFVHMFTDTLPAFRRMGLTPQEETALIRANPQRIIPVQ